MPRRSFQNIFFPNAIEKDFVVIDVYFYICIFIYVHVYARTCGSMICVYLCLHDPELRVFAIERG